MRLDKILATFKTLKHMGHRCEKCLTWRIFESKKMLVINGKN